MSKTLALDECPFWNFGFRSFVFVSDFVLRNSNFDDVGAHQIVR
jgi:hypothetical protein